MASEIAVHMFAESDGRIKKLRDQNKGCPEGLATINIGVLDKATGVDIVKVVTEKTRDRRIRVMRTVAHGNAGIYWFPGFWNVHLVSQDFMKLTPLFAGIARLELHGCGLASETDILKPGIAIRDANETNTVPGTFTGRSTGAGLVFLRRIASIFKIPVVAGIDVQRVHLDTFDFQGDTVTVQPNGKFSMDSEGTRDWDVAATNRAANQYLLTIDRQYVSKGQYQAAIRELRLLMRDYPRSSAAAWASRHLSEDALKRDPYVMVPD